MKYWVYRNGEVPGSYEPAELARIPDFTAVSMVCPAEGSVAERNWQRAGLFPDIAEVLRQRDAQTPPQPLPTPPARDFAFLPEGPLGPEQVLEAAGQRLFRHVTELMKELENRREERALAQSLQRSLAELKSELQAARERILSLEQKAALVPGYEEREKRLQEAFEKTRADLGVRERALKGLMRELEEAHVKAEESRHALAELAREKTQISHMHGSLNHQLAEKELALSKALALIQRLEEELSRIIPDSTAGISREAPRRDDPYRDVPRRDDPYRDVPPRGTERVEGENPSSPYPPAPPPAPAEPPLQSLAFASEPPPSPEPQPPPPPPAQLKVHAWPTHPQAPVPERTDDDGHIDHPVPMPPEGEVAPIQSPLSQAFSRLAGFFKSFL